MLKGIQKRKMLMLLVVAMLMISMLMGCGQEAAPENGEEEVAPENGEEVAAITWGTRLTVATGGTGGVYFPYGGRMAEIITTHVEGFDASAEVTGASVENMKLVHDEETQIGLSQEDVVYQAFHGTGVFEGDPQDILNIFGMYPSTFHVLTLAGSGIESFADLKGQRISIGAAGSGTTAMADLVFGALDITHDDFTVERLSFTEQAGALKDGHLDAAVWLVGAPTSTIIDLATTHDIRILCFTSAELNKVVAEYPFYAATTITPDVYGLDEPVNTIGVWNMAVVHRDAPEEYVYQVVRAIFEQQDELIKVHPLANWTTPQNTVDKATIPLHPGAIRYLEEIGIEVPDRLRPPS
ncbi:TAXI family TRAP transporter solute-binding subunit [candidate division NPL-UPA2 bacterium]|nr:TAXI family TRAP transporter solute-binding subunit [candidate division NPL-UPA2 bacterium]